VDAVEQTPPAGEMAAEDDAEPAYLRDMPAFDEAPAVSEPEPAPTPAQAAPTVSLPSAPDPLSDRWAALVAQLVAKGSIVALVRELAMQAQCVSQKEEGGVSHWTLKVERESLRTDMQRERLTQAMSALLDQTVAVELIPGVASNTPAQRDQAAREARQRQAEHIITTDPLVTSLLNQYPGARIVAGSIRPL
jgi:DNA polymerase-3 subunit gamma/tau